MKPPERSRFNFGMFSLAVVAAAIRDIANVSLLDLTAHPVEDAIAEVRAREPDVIGVTTMALASVPQVARFLTALRASEAGLRGRPIITGGQGATMVPALLLDAGADAVVLGEGERIFRRIVQVGIEPDAAGLATRINGKHRLNERPPLIEPLDSLEPPARDLMPDAESPVHLIETSRGCPHACAFCATTRFHGRRWRYKSVQRVVAEVRHLVEDHNAWIIHVTDDNFAASRRRAIQLGHALVKEAVLPACFMVSGRAEDPIPHKEVFPALAAANFLRISVGVESLDPALNGVTGKSLAIADYKALFDRMRQLGVFSVASFIVGLPGETEASRQLAAEWARAAAPDVARFVPFHPQPWLAGQASGRFDPTPEDVREAEACNSAFLAAPEVQERLRAAVEAGGIRGLFARGTLEKRSWGLDD